MNFRIFQKGFNYSQDGPGNRLVFHMQGCNMRCPWCSNPEGISAVPHPSCNTAVEMGVDDVVREAVSCRSMYFSGGGVTFTGGEPTLQFAVLAELLPKLKAEEIGTAMETNGTHPRLNELMPFVDHFMMDVKLMNAGRHKQWTGVDNAVILDNIRMVAKSSTPLQVRIPLVHGVNDADDDLDDFVEFFGSLGGADFTVEVLSYHEYGKDKWEKCGMQYTITDGHIPAGVAKAFEKRLTDAGVKVIRT